MISGQWDWTWTLIDKVSSKTFSCLRARWSTSPETSSVSRHSRTIWIELDNDQLIERAELEDQRTTFLVSNNERLSVGLFESSARRRAPPKRAYHHSLESCMMSGATRLDQDWMRMVELRGGTGMTSGLSGRSSSRLHYTILTILDTVFSATVAAPAVVGYWRGTWGLSDVYVYPEDPVFSSLTSIVIGFIGLYAFNVSQNVLNELLHPDKHRLSYYVGSRLYTAVFGFCCVNAWRGAWQALDLYTEHTASTVFATTIVSLLALAIMRAVRNISAPPFSLCLDSCPGYFEVQTMFRVNVSNRKYHFVTWHRNLKNYCYFLNWDKLTKSHIR